MNRPTHAFNALLLAAGLGTRLKPITQIIPKCLAPVNNEPLLGQWIRKLLETNVNHIFVNGHAGADLVLQYLKQANFWSHIQWMREKKIAGTGGTFVQTLNHPKLNDLPLMVIHVDNYSNLNIQDFLEAHQNRPNKTHAATLALFETDHPASCGMVEVDETDCLIRFLEKPDPNKIKINSKLANAAIYLFAPEHIKKIIAGQVIHDLSRDLIPQLIHRAHTYYHPGFHIDIGRIESFAEAWLRTVSD